jgi:hypothetical protein
MPAGDPNIDEAPVGEAAMGKEYVEVHASFWLRCRLRSLAHRPCIMNQPG